MDLARLLLTGRIKGSIRDSTKATITATALKNPTVKVAIILTVISLEAELPATVLLGILVFHQTTAVALEIENRAEK